ncbi:MAG: hypothetical protein FWD13_02955 [Treponema sp.]|nr:hypothetical protein [Treponema sp.]
MFKLLTRRNLLIAFLTVLLTITAVVILTTCDMPVGLGTIVNTDKPEIGMPDDPLTNPGAFLRGEVTIPLEVRQDFGIETVYMVITYICKETNKQVTADGDPNDPRYDPESPQYNPIYIRDNPPLYLAYQKANNGINSWYVDIDTRIMRDGEIRAVVTAIDVSGNRTVTTDIIYFVKNIPPQIELTLPRIKGEGFDTITPSSPVLRSGTIFQGNDLMGIASDAYGLAHGYPEIRIWPVEDPAFPGVIPTPLDADGFPLDPPWNMWWTTFDDQTPLDHPSYANMDLKATQFRFPLREFINDGGVWRFPTAADGENRKDLPTGYYRFQIRVRDKFENSDYNVYPNRTDHTVSEANLPNQNKFIQLQIIATENPIIRWESAFDISGTKYDGFPNFYNGANDLEVYLTIDSGNTITKTFARVSNTDSVEFLANDDIYVSPVPFIPNGYKITIPFDQIPDTIPGNKSGDKVLHIEAEDNLGNKTTTSRGIVIDVTPPDLNFIEPDGLNIFNERPIGSLVENDYPMVTATVTMRGNATDNQRVVAMYYALGKTEVAAVGNDPNATGWIDTGLGTIDGPITSHPNSGGIENIHMNWNGTLSSWTLRFNDITELNFGAQPATGNYFVTGHSGNGLPIENPNPFLWILPIKFKVVDIAGNILIREIRMIIDPDADSPKVEVNSHTNDQIVGGSVRVSGIAIDNDWVHSIWYRIVDHDRYPNPPPDGWGSGAEPANKGDWNKEEGYSGWMEAVKVGAGSVVSWYCEINKEGELDPLVQGTTRKIFIEIRPVDSALFDDNRLPKRAGHMARLNLEFSNTVPIILDGDIIWGAPADDNFSNISTLPKTDNTTNAMVSEFITLAPRVRSVTGITNIRYRPSGVPNTIVLYNVSQTGETTISEIKPDKSSAWVVLPKELTSGDSITRGRKYWIKVEGTGTFTDPSADGSIDGTFIASRDSTVPAGFTLVEANIGELEDDFQQFEYIVYIPLDTTSTQSGMLNIDLEVFDNTKPQPYRAQKAFTLRVDNYYPTAEFIGNPNAYGPNYIIRGDAWDSATGVIIGAVDRVVVYFSNNDGTEYGTPVYLPGSDAGDWDLNTEKVVINRRSTEFGVIAGDNTTPAVLPFFPKITRTEAERLINYSSKAGIVIYTNATIDGRAQTFAYETDKIVRWTVQFNSNQLPNGHYYLNYVVYDAAGNASWFKDEITVRNNAPVISKVDLMTDLVGGRVTTLWERRTADSINTNFTASNKSLGFDITAARGSPATTTDLNYRVSYITGYEDPINVKDMQRGVLYEITNTGANTNWDYIGVRDVTSTPPVGTMFIASGPAKESMRSGAVITGMVRQVNYVAASPGNPRTQISSSTPITFTGSDFDNPETTGIPENEVLNSLTFFVKAFDSMIGENNSDVLTNEANQLSDFRIARLAINNTDDVLPIVKITDDFGFKFTSDSDNYDNRIQVGVADYIENIIMNGDTKMGYVQYAVHSQTHPEAFSDNAYVSGKVIIKGKAMDNGRIARMEVSIDGGDPFVIARANTSGVLIVEGGNSIAAMSTSSNEWGFNIEAPRLTLDYGHVINWEFAWDSSKIEGMAKSDVVIEFTAIDAATPVNTSIAASVTVDVVPYIEELITPLSAAFSSTPSAFNRSARGWYPVKENDPVYIRGFNLGATGNAALISDVNVYVGGKFAGNDEPEDGTLITPTAVQNPLTSLFFSDVIGINIGAIADSGDLTVRVNGINSINNRTNIFKSGDIDTPENRIHYNWEPNGVNNNVLSNNRGLYIWRVGSLYTAPPATSTEFPFLNPVMRMDQDSNWYLSYGSTSTAGQLIVVKNGTRNTMGATATNRWRHTTVAFDDRGGVYTMGANQTAGSVVYRFAFRLMNTAGSGLNDATIIQSLDNFNAPTNANPLRAAGGDRFRNPRVATKTPSGTISADNPIKVLVSYFDTIDNDNNRLYIHNGTVWNTTAAAQSSALGTSQEVANNSVTHQGSMFTAVGYLSSGRPVISWYDRTKMNLVLSYGGSEEGNYTPTGSMEYIYTADNHGFTGNGAGRTSAVYVRTGTQDIVAEDLRYIRAIGSDKFILSSAENGVGQNEGASIRVDRAIPVTANLSTLGAAGTGNNQRTGMPGNYTASPVAFTLPAGHGLRLGDRVDIINGATVARDAYVVWLGMPGQGNANQVVLKEANGNFVAGDGGALVPNFTTGTTFANMYVVLKSRAATTNPTVSSVQTATSNNNTTQATGRNGIMYSNAAGTTAATNTALPNNTRTFTLQANHGLTVGDWVDITYLGTTYRRVVGWRGAANDTNLNNVAFKTTVGTANNADWFNTVPAGTAGAQITITRINNPIGNVQSNTMTSERSYTSAGHNLNNNQVVTVNGNSYYVTQVIGNRFKLTDTLGGTTISDLGASINLTYSNTNTVTGIGTWQANAKVVHGPDSTGTRPRGAAGSHVDMVIDKNNNIHLAYYDVLNGGLYYALVPVTNNIIPDVDSATVVKVDTYLSAGTRIMLNVREENGRFVPYISYFHGSFDETRNSIRVAWQHSPTLAAGSDANDRLTGAWEVMTVPTERVPVSGEIITSGAPSNNTISGATYGSFNGQDITKSMIVGYLTSFNYEAATLKHSLY